MLRLIWTVVVAFVMALTVGPFVIPALKKWKFGQTINAFGPQSHRTKQGVPTMGGLIFIVPALAAALIFSRYDGPLDALILVLLCMLGFGAIGFVDDFIKVTRHRNLGLTPRQKLVPQIVLAMGISLWAYTHPAIGDGLTVPFTEITWSLGWAYIPLMTFIIVGTVNSANLLDGLDGLLGGCSMFDFATMALITMTMAVSDGGADPRLLNVALFCGAMTGALLGFLRFNTHPANVFMGDVGSFAIGGALVGVAIVTRLSLLLPLIALAMVVSSVSDIIQVGYFRWSNGKRVFRMAPLHHHFELSGIPETRIVAMYQTGTAILCLMALSGFVA